MPKTFNSAIRADILQYLFFPQTDAGQRVNSKVNALDLGSVAGVFLVLSGGLVFAGVLAVRECWWGSRRQASKSGVRRRQAFKSGVGTFIFFIYQ